MEDRIQQVYDLYRANNLISEAIDLNTFTDIDDNQRQQLYDLGKSRGLFSTTDFGTFTTAWTSATMEADKEPALEDELQAPKEEVVEEVVEEKPALPPVIPLDELNEKYANTDDMSEEEYNKEVARTMDSIMARGKALGLNVSETDNQDEPSIDFKYDKLAKNAMPAMDNVVRNGVAPGYYESLQKVPMVKIEEVPDETFAESTGITKQVVTQISNEEANLIQEENKVKPTEEQTKIQKLFNGRGPAYYDERSIEEQTKDYNDSVMAINGSKLTDQEKYVKLSNLHKPTYSTLKEVDGKMEFVIKPEFQEKVDLRFKDLGKAFEGKDLNDPEVQQEMQKYMKDMSQSLITSDPILRQQSVAIQNLLKPKYDEIGKSIRVKYKLDADSDEKTIEAANNEFQKLTSKLFQDKMAASPVYQHVTQDIQKAIGVSADNAKQSILKGTNPIYALAEDLKDAGGPSAQEAFIDNPSYLDMLLYAPRKVLETGGILIEQGYSAINNMGKDFNAAQISQQQLGLAERTTQINEIKNIQSAYPGKEIYAYPDGTLDYSKMGISTIGKGDVGGLTEGQKPKQKYSVSGNEWKSSVVNPEEYIANREVKNAKSEEVILSDLEELQKFAGVAELATKIDFDDEDGMTYADVVGTVGQVLPNIGVGVGAAALAPVTGGMSLLGSSLMIGGQEYGANYWGALEEGLTEELGREPTNEEIVDALANDKYADQGTAAGWAALSAGLELGTFGTISKALKGYSKVFKSTPKDFVNKIMKGELKNAVKKGRSALVEGGKGYVKEYFTEAAQELASQASIGQQVDNDILKRIDLQSAHQAGTGGGIVGFVLPNVGSMRRGTTNMIRKSARQAAITLNLKGAENFKQQTKFFQDAQSALKTKYDNGELTPEEYQFETEAISDLRNSSLKIPKEYSNTARAEALDLMVEQKKLKIKAEEQLDEFSKKDKERLSEVSQQLEDLANNENAINNAMKFTKSAGLDVNIVRKKNSAETQKELRKFNLNKKQSKAASKNFGVHVVDGKDGKRSIILNEEAIKNKKKWTTAQHEVLHDVLSVALKGNDRAVFAMGNAVDNLLKNVDGKSNANFKKRLDAYKKKPESTQAEEKITLLSEAITNGDVTFDEGVFTKLGDFVRRVFQQIAPDSKLGKIKFDTAEDVYRFIKDYNKSFAKGKVTRAQQNVLDKGVEVSQDITPQGPLQQQDVTTKESIDEAALEEEGLTIQDDIDQDFDTPGVEQVDEIIREIPQDIKQEDNKEFDETAADEEIVEGFRPLATFIAKGYKGNAKYNQQRQNLIESILKDERGVLGLFKAYKEKVAAGEFDGTAGQFINNRKAGIRQRSKQIAAEVLGFAAPKTGPKKSPIPEGRQEKQSLRRTMGFFTTKELDQMLADREINKAEYDKLLKSSQQQVIKKGPNKGKTYGEVIDGFFNKVKTQIQKGVLTSPKQIVNYLTNEFKTKRFVADIKDLMGTPNSQQYADFLNNFSEAIYGKLTQRQINKRFDFAKEPVINPKTGKQKRMTVGESQAVGSQVSDVKAGNPVFTKKAFNKDEFVEQHLNPTTGRPASKQTALAESVAEVIGFDASQQALQDPETLSNLTDRNVGMAELEAISNDLSNQAARGMTFKFSLDEELDPLINEEARTQVVEFLEEVIEIDDINQIELLSEVLDTEAKQWLEDSGLLDMFKEGAKGFKGPLKAFDWGNFNNLKDKYFNNRTDKNNEVAMEELATTMDQMIDLLPPVVLKFMPPNMLGLISGGRLLDISKLREDTNYRYLRDKFENKAQQATEKDLEKFIKENGFDPSNIEIMNANFGLFNDIQKVLAQQIPSKTKQETVEREFGNRIRKANEANPKAYKYLVNEMAKAVQQDPNNLIGIARLLEGNTNNTKGFRGLTTLSLIEFDDNSQAPYFDPNTGKYAFTQGEAKRKNIGVNVDHYLYKEASQIADEILPLWEAKQIKKGNELTPEIIEQKRNEIIAERLRFKGEHVDPQANVSSLVTKALIDYANDIKNEVNNEVALNELNNKVEDALKNYDQTLGAEALSYLQDDALGKTSKLAFLRNMVIPKSKMNKWRTPDGLTAEQYTNKKIREQDNVVKLNRSQEVAKDDNVVMLKESKVVEADDNMSMDDVLNKAKTVDEALKQAKKLNTPVKKIRVFDFDDTLATTESNVIANRGDESITLTAEEFAEQGKSLLDQGYKFDFTEFDKVTKGKEGPLLKIAKKIKDARGNEDLFVLTARAPQAQQAIYEFLKSQGVEFKKDNIIGLGNSTGAAKANWIVNQAAKGYNDFYFADDSIQNVQAVRDALDVIDVKSQVQQAKIKFSENIDKDFNDIIEQKSGVASEKRYSKAKAEVRGANKGRFKFWIPYSAEDFMGLIYPLLSKGKLGDSQMAWFKEHLFDPFAKAAEALSAARLQLMNDFKALKKDLDVPAELSKDAGDGFTNEQAVRVYLWNKQGLDIPGLSKTDIKELTDVIESNPKLKLFADKLLQINKDPYPAPQDSWLAGTITTDLIAGLKVKRSSLLEQWQANADAIFSEENMNKLEAIYGSKYVEALRNVLSRMKAGSNRLQTGNRLSNRILNYINGSNAAIMFFNTRSAILQTISSINFINWDFNNPLKAGKAFANQPQYWSDFMELMNGEFLKDRRNGLRININESEIADLAKTTKNKAKAVMAYILEKGYLPTQFADSFAIALGGATFYRNRINDLMKNEGMTEAEAKKQAMTEFREIAEESQQSARPDKISQQQSSDVGRLILMFANTPMQYARLQKRAFQDLMNGRGSSKANISKIIYYGVVQNIIFNALQQAMFKMGFGDEDEEDDEKRTYRTLNGMLDSTLRGLGIGGATVSVAKNFLLDIYERSDRSRPEYTDAVWKLLQFSPPIGSKISKLRQAGWAFDSKKRRQEILDKGFSLDNPGLMSFAKVISATGNIPLDRVLSKYENIEGVMSEESEWWQKLAMAGGWPKWDIMKDGTDRKPPKSKKSKLTKSGLRKTKKRKVKRRN